VRRRLFGGVGIVLVLLAMAVPSLGTSVEARLGTGPSVSILADWSVTRWLDVGASLGVRFGDGVQTPPMVVQTPSVTVGLHARVTFADPDSSLVPYLGLGTELSFRGGEISGRAQFAGGLRVRVASNLYVLGEGSLAVPIWGPGQRRVVLIVGIRYEF